MKASNFGNCYFELINVSSKNKMINNALFVANFIIRIASSTIYVTLLTIYLMIAVKLAMQIVKFAMLITKFKICVNGLYFKCYRFAALLYLKTAFDI